MNKTRRDANGLTPMLGAIYNVLADGEWHSRAELMIVIDNDRKVLYNLMWSLRQEIKSRGLLIFCHKSPTAGIGYQLTRKLSSVRDGGG